MAPFGWFGILLLFIIFNVYIFFKEKGIALLFIKRNFYIPYFIMFLIFLICLSPTIKADLISFLAYNTDLVEHINTAALYSKGKYIFSDYPGYHILLAFFYRLSFSRNIVSLFVMFNAYLVSLLFGILIFLFSIVTKIKNSKYIYYIYLVVFIISLSPLVLWASEDNFAPQLIGILAVPMVVGFSIYMVREKFSFSSIFFTAISIDIILYSYPAAAISIAGLLFIFYLFQLKNIRRLIILVLLSIILLIPFYKNVTDFVSGSSSSISNKISINPNIAGGFFRRNTLPSLISIIPVYRTYNGPDLNNPPRLSLVYNNNAFRYIISVVFVLFIFYIPFLIYFFRKSYIILSLLIGDLLLNIFAYFYISPYGDFKIVSFNVFVLPLILFLSIIYLKKNKDILNKVFTNLSFILLLLFLSLSLLGSFLIIIDTTHVVIQQRPVNSLYGNLNQSIPKESKILFIDNSLNNDIIFKELMHNYNVIVYDNFNDNTESIKNLGLSKAEIIDNNITQNINIYKDINSYNYVIIKKQYLDNYQQFLLPVNFVFQQNIDGYYIFKSIYSNYKYINLDKVNNYGVNNPYVITGFLNFRSILNTKNINSNQSIIISLMSFEDSEIKVGGSNIKLERGYNIIKLSTKYLNKELTFINQTPILIYNISILNSNQLRFLNLYINKTLTIYKHFLLSNILNNNLNIKVGVVDDRKYLAWFHRMDSFGNNSTYRFFKRNSVLSIPILGSYSKLNIKFKLGMFGLSNRVTDVQFSTNTCPNIYSYSLGDNDKTRYIKFSIPKECISNNYLELYFNQDSNGNQVLITNISISKG